jgi:hypothetical protein
MRTGGTEQDQITPSDTTGASQPAQLAAVTLHSSDNGEQHRCGTKQAVENMQQLCFFLKRTCSQRGLGNARLRGVGKPYGLLQILVALDVAKHILCLLPPTIIHGLGATLHKVAISPLQ